MTAAGRREPAAAELQVAQPQATGETVDDFLRGPGVDPRHVRSKEEIDDFLRAERESWE